MAVDLHIHSTVSDGTLTPEEIVAEAQRIGLSAIAISDHDSVDGIDRALAAAEGSGLLVLPAVEISTEAGNTEVHILGFYMDYREPRFLELLGKICEGRVQRAEKTVQKLNELGLKLSYADVLAFAGGMSVGRPHVAAALLHAGHVRSQNEAFDRYLRRGKPAYVPRYKLSPPQAVKVIVDAGGLAAMAHPGLARHDDIIDELISCGLGGLEAYHTEHRPADAQRYTNMARRRGLLITGGTDSHGPGGPNPVAIGSVCVPDICATSLRDWALLHGRI